ncbi:hypothetical protein [Streptomyces sp. SAI-208]|jgi:hypothetical protein|uniref:hypothetical protein n=1 Tax=Streptomyces sp. SAI-208 TaxID=2940550 RepID=UPI0024740722|nr:hypothetical protein [Streptomyces sp. SAI-208]
MTDHARHQEPGSSLGRPTDVRGRHAVPGRGDFLEFLGLMLAVGALCLLVVHPETPAVVVHALASGTVGLVR